MKVVKELSVIYCWARILSIRNFLETYSISIFWHANKPLLPPRAAWADNRHILCRTYPWPLSGSKTNELKKKLVCDQFIFQRPVNDIGISKIFQFPNHFLVINWLFKKWFYMSGGELVELWLRETQLVDTFLNDDCTNRNCAMVNIATAQIR